MLQLRSNLAKSIRENCTFHISHLEAISHKLGLWIHCALIYRWIAISFSTLPSSRADLGNNFNCPSAKSILCSVNNKAIFYLTKQYEIICCFSPTAESRCEARKYQKLCFHMDRFIEPTALRITPATILRFHAKTKFESLKKWRVNDYHQREIYRIFCCAFVQSFVGRGNRNVGRMKIADSELETSRLCVLRENQFVLRLPVQKSSFTSVISTSRSRIAAKTN